MGSHTKLDTLKRDLLKKKLWFVTNTFILIPFSTWLFWVYLYPFVELTKSNALTMWFEWWSAIFVLAQSVYCAYLFLMINELRVKIEDIEWDMRRNK